MKKIFKFLAIGILSLLGIGLFLPGSAKHMQKETTITAPLAKVYGQVSELKNWATWSPWIKKDPAIAMSYSPTTTGIGSYFAWESKKEELGNGKMTIMNTEVNKSLQTKTEFGGKGAAIGNFKFEIPANDSTKTKVTWSFDMDYGVNPIARWFGVLMGDKIEKMVGDDYTSGLQNLKKVCE
jgi:Polyketide cyclase / dehydrase and lipid transport